MYLYINFTLKINTVLFDLKTIKFKSNSSLNK